MSGRGEPYVCALCGRTFTTDWTDAEAHDEHLAVFGSTPSPEDSETVCDDCYAKIVAWADANGLTVEGHP